MIVPDKIIRSERKTLAVSIDRLGRVTVRAPKRCTDERIFCFLRDKENWILRKKSQRQGAGMDLPAENLDGYCLLLVGKAYRIQLYDGKKIGVQDDRIFVPIERSKEKLVRWIKENAKRILTQITFEKAKEMAVNPSVVRVTSAKTRWGSCSAKNAVAYSFRLLYAPKQTLEYVVIHELAHIRHKNHSKRFWEEVAKYCPNWKEHRSWLKQNAWRMEIF